MARLQRKWCSVAVSAAVVAMAAGAAQSSAPWPAVATSKESPVLAALAESPRMPWIIGFRDAPAVTFGAALEAGPTPPLAGKVGFSIADNIDAYAKRLEAEQIGIEARLKREVGREFAVQHRMQHAFNGIVAELTAVEAAALAADPAVALVEPYTEYLLDDEVAPGVIGAPTVWADGTGVPRAAFVSRDRTGVSFFNRRAKGEGVVVGIIDTGINFASPSFAEVDPVSGFRFSNPRGEGSYTGTCAAGGVDAGRCNDKLIGGWDFVCGPPANLCGQANIGEEPGFGDNDSHGTHTAGTSAGNERLASFRGNTVAIAGIAPRAHVIAYDACYVLTTTGQGLCPSVSTLAAINQAVADGVDVINYSIGGGAQPWSEAVSQAFLAASDAGIFVSASAGNSGPGPSTNGHNQPWVMTVAAAQSGRHGFEFTLETSGAPANLASLLLNQGSGGVELSGSIAGTLRAGPNFAGAADGCTASGAFPAGFFANRIALVRRGTCAFTEKAANAAAAGARAVVIVNNTTGVIAPSVPGATLPVFGLPQAEGVALAGLAAGATPLSANIPFPATRLTNTVDQLAAFSSRGPGPFSVMKPDLTGHGVNILAATACATPALWTTPACVNRIGLLSGTSMSAPQVAGAGALLRQIFPDWSPAEIKSALMMTAAQTVLLEGGTTRAHPFAAGAGRVQVDAAARAGLVLDQTRAGYVAANPATGGDPSTLNLASLTHIGCGTSTCTFTRTFRSTRASFQTYSVALSGLAGSISTPVLSIAPFGTATVTVTVNTADQPSDGVSRFGTLTLTPTGAHPAAPAATLRLPVAVAVRAPQLALSTEAIAVSAPANTTRTLSFNVWSATSPVDFSTTLTGTGTGTLVSQSSAGATSGYATGLYTDLGTGQFAADDFVLTQTTPLTSIANEGFVLGTGVIPPTTVIRWSIFPDAGGVPAGNPQTAPNAAVWSHATPANGPGVSTTGGTLRLNLAAAGQSLSLPAGRYWLVPQVNTLFANRFAWFFSLQGNDTRPRTIVPGRAAPGNLWSTPTGAPVGLAFTVNGTVGCGAPWIGGLTPASGRGAAGAPATVNFTVNTAGLAPGNYSGFVCLGSTDPARPSATVRVALTVTP